jgi:PiT family inorganic phosphate transporter
MADWLVVGGIITLALAFDFVNGFHDAANSIATVVSTRVLSPRWAVAWAAFFNLVAFLVFPATVAVTIGKGVVSPDVATIPVITAGLVGASLWDLLTWYWGIPTSSSHALVGGLAGAALVYAGWGSLIPSGLALIGLFIFIAPVLGLVMGFCFMITTYWLFRNATPLQVGGLFRKLQFCSAAAYSLGHGGNDAQKTMGIIAIVLIASGHLTQGDVVPEHLPLWIVLACHTAMGLGTLCGGWRIVKTMGQKICVLHPVHGFAAETSGSACQIGRAHV